MQYAPTVFDNKNESIFRCLPSSILVKSIFTRFILVTLYETMYIQQHKLSNMSKPGYKLLFHLDNEKIEIVEVKRNGILEEDKNKIYVWLLYDKVNDMLSRLEFVSMKSAENKEYREFENSKLEMDKTSGIYKEGDKTFEMKVIPSDKPLLTILQDAVSDYLLMLNFRSER